MKLKGCLRAYAFLLECQRLNSKGWQWIGATELLNLTNQDLAEKAGLSAGYFWR